LMTREIQLACHGLGAERKKIIYAWKKANPAPRL
jgi:hypothetical protein